jgi:hypothetical protein
MAFSHSGFAILRQLSFVISDDARGGSFAHTGNGISSAQTQIGGRISFSIISCD